MNWSEAANVATAVGLAAAAVGLAMTVFQMRAAERTARAQFLHDLEVDAQRFQSLFKYLLPIDSPLTEERHQALLKDELLLFSSLNFFEKIELLIENGSVDLKSIDSLFAGRFFLLVHSPLVQSMTLLNQQYIDYFSSVARLYRRWYLYRRSRGLPIFFEKNVINEFLRTD